MPNLDEVVASLWFRLEEWEQSYKARQSCSASAGHPECNRYRDIVPYDEYRVVLKTRPHDYINASHIREPSLPPSIAVQAPHNEEVFANFWAMVREQNVRVIVMVANNVEDGRVKVHRYWPEKGSRSTYDQTHVQLMTEVKESFHIERKFIYSYNGQASTIVHYQFTEWPDKGVPSTPEQLIGFAEKVREELRQSLIKGSAGSSLLVHCSAGIGRTGTFLALLAAMERLDRGEMPDLEQLVMSLRTCRFRMVQVQAQLKFLALCVAAYSQSLQTKGKKITVKTQLASTLSNLARAETQSTRSIRRRKVNTTLSGASGGASQDPIASALLANSQQRSSTPSADHPNEQSKPVTSFDLLGDLSSEPAQAPAPIKAVWPASSTSGLAFDLFGSTPFQAVSSQQPSALQSTNDAKGVDLFGLPSFAGASTATSTSQPTNTVSSYSSPTVAAPDRSSAPQRTSNNPFESSASASTSSSTPHPAGSNMFDLFGGSGSSGTFFEQAKQPPPSAAFNPFAPQSTGTTTMAWPNSPQANASTDLSLFRAAAQPAAAPSGGNAAALQQSGWATSIGQTSTGWPGTAVNTQQNTAGFSFNQTGAAANTSIPWQASVIPSGGSQPTMSHVPQQASAMPAFASPSASFGSAPSTFPVQGVQTNAMMAPATSTAFPASSYAPSSTMPFGMGSAQPAAAPTRMPFSMGSAQPSVAGSMSNGWPQAQAMNFSPIQQQQAVNTYSGGYSQWSQPGSVANTGMAAGPSAGMAMSSTLPAMGGWPSQMQPAAAQMKKPASGGTADLLGDFSLAAITSSLKL